MDAETFCFPIIDDHPFAYYFLLLISKKESVIIVIHISKSAFLSADSKKGDFMQLSIIYNYLDTGPGIWEILLRMGLTAFFVGLIGIERQMRHKIAGVTTHLMVAFGACGIAILQDSLYFEALRLATDLAGQGITVNLERQRVIAQVVTGVGFLGAGTILKTSNGISGLTTAATIWLASMIGLCFGMGGYVIGIVLSVFSLVFLTGFRKLLELTTLKHVKSPETLGAEVMEK